MSLLNMICSKCGQSLYRAMLLALAQDAGAHVYPDATACSEGGEHNFVEPSQPKRAPAMEKPR